MSATEFRIEFIELDAQMQMQSGYVDDKGKWVETMTQEEWRAERERLKGHILLRAVLTEGGEHIAIETRTALSEERVLLVEEITQAVATLMEKRLTAASSTRAQSGSALPLC